MRITRRKIKEIYSKQRDLNNKLKYFFENNYLRINKNICPYCLAKGNEINILLNIDDNYECPKCKMLISLFYEPNNINAVFILGQNGSGLFKDDQPESLSLFKELLVLVNINKQVNGFKNFTELINFIES